MNRPFLAVTLILMIVVAVRHIYTTYQRDRQPTVMEQIHRHADAYTREQAAKPDPFTPEQRMRSMMNEADRRKADKKP